MKANKNVLMVATTALVALGSIGLMGAMKYYNVKTEATEIKEDDITKTGVDVTSESMEGETPIDRKDKMDKEVVETYTYKDYQISFFRYKDKKTGEYLSDKEQEGDYGYKKTFREIIDASEKDGWSYMLSDLKGMKNKITAEIDWYRDEDKIVNGKYYGKLVRECRIHFMPPAIKDPEKYIQLETIGNFKTIAETGEYSMVGKTESMDLIEYPNQWPSVSKEKRRKVQRKINEFEQIKNCKEKEKQLIKKYKTTILKKLKEEYGINVVKELKKKNDCADYFVHKASVSFCGVTDEDKEILIEYDILGGYIYYFHYCY